jgi:hypothetical protein
LSAPCCSVVADLDPTGAYDLLPPVAQLFPGVEEDYFGRIIDEARAHLSDGASGVRSLLEHFYWAAG